MCEGGPRLAQQVHDHQGDDEVSRKAAKRAKNLHVANSSTSSRAVDRSHVCYDMPVSPEFASMPGYQASERDR
jgi:hypothetical protein